MASNCNISKTKYLESTNFTDNFSITKFTLIMVYSLQFGYLILLAMATVLCPNVSVFQEARDRVQSEIDLILQCLENKKVEMFAVIKEIEVEYLSRQQEIQKNINEINTLMKQTKELTSLQEAQNTIMEVLQKELSIASIQESDCSVEFEWGFSRDVICKINSITLKRLDTDKVRDRTSRKCPPNPDGSDIPTSDETHIAPKEHDRNADHSVPSSRDLDTTGTSEDSDDTTGEASESEEELPIIEGSEVELIHQAPESALDGATDYASYLLRGKGGRKLKLAMSEIAITEIHSDCLLLFESGRLPRIYASDIEVICGTESELTVHAKTAKVTASYPVKKYSCQEVASLKRAGELAQHLLAEERDWCLIEVSGYDTLFGSRDLTPDD